MQNDLRSIGHDLAMTTLMAGLLTLLVEKKAVSPHEIERLLLTTQNLMKGLGTEIGGCGAGVIDTIRGQIPKP